MLCRNDQLLKSGVFQRFYIVVGIEIIFQLKNLIRRFVSVVFAPLNLIKRVGSEMTERCKLVLLVPVLVLVGSTSSGLGASVLFSASSPSPIHPSAACTGIPVPKNVDAVMAAVIMSARLLTFFFFTIFPFLES